MAAVSDTASPRALRADAERNRARIMDAAAELFAQKGLSVGLDEIARHAGVGVATAYRRFPDKEQLIDALFEERLQALLEIAEQAGAYEDPWAGLVFFMEHAIEEQSRDRGLKELVFGTEHCRARADRVRDLLAPIIEELVERAQAAGSLRPEIAATDVALLQFMLSAVADFGAPPELALWQRCLGIVLAGMRAGDDPPLAGRPLSNDELTSAMSTAHVARRRA